MKKNFFEHINIDINNTFVPNGCAVDLAGEGKRYDEHIAELGGIDLQLLGIGLDGYIGFNEPDKYFVKSTHVVDLHESTIKANSRFFASEDEVPKKAITMGMVSIMQAKKILLIASGKEKRDNLKKAFYGLITPEIPASILQLHPDITVIIIYNALIGRSLKSVKIKDGKIEEVTDNVKSGDINAGGNRLIPGLIDVHTHGCIGMDTMDADFEPMCKFYAEHGTTSFLPTTMTMGYDALEKVTNTKTDFDGANILGFHFEGPYISPKHKGAQNEKYIKNPSVEDGGADIFLDSKRSRQICTRKSELQLIFLI